MCFFSFLLISHLSPEPNCCAVLLTLYKDPLVLVLITTATEVNVDELLDGVHLLLGLLASLLLLVEELDGTSDSHRAVELGEGGAAELLLELADEGGLAPSLDGTREVLDLAPVNHIRLSTDTKQRLRYQRITHGRRVAFVAISARTSV